MKPERYFGTAVDVLLILGLAALVWAGTLAMMIGEAH